MTSLVSLVSVVSPVSAVTLAIVVATMSGTLVGVVRARRRASRRRAGAVGEQHTAATLDGLARRGLVALHDRRVPGMDRANIDHVVVGRRGVFTVETKRYAGRVTLGGVFGLGRLRPRHNGKRIDHVVDQAIHQADAVRRTLDDRYPVTPLVVIHNAELASPRLRRPVTDGVRWCRGDDLARALGRGPVRLSRRQIHSVADQLDRAL
jgi:hypothetical protein